MDVATIIANIKSQALVGNTGAADDEARILRYLNKAYSAIYAEISSLNPALYQKRQPLTITAGEGTFGTLVFKVLAAVDTGNSNKRLATRSTDDIEMSDPLASAQGSPESYEQTFDGLTTYPRNDTTLSVRYIPNPDDLTADTLEAEIKVPKLYHEALEWATLWTIAYDERDKLLGSELQFTKETFKEQMDKLRLYVTSTIAQDKLRVKAFS